MQKNKIMQLQWNVTHSRNHSVHLQVTVEYNSQQKSQWNTKITMYINTVEHSSQ